MSRLFTIFLLAIAPIYLTGQNLVECATDEILAQRFAENPALQQAQEVLENQAFQHFDQLRNTGSADKSQQLAKYAKTCANGGLLAFIDIQ